MNNLGEFAVCFMILSHFRPKVMYEEARNEIALVQADFSSCI
jgi:hypothetical protein